MALRLSRAVLLALCLLVAAGAGAPRGEVEARGAHRDIAGFTAGWSRAGTDDIGANRADSDGRYADQLLLPTDRTDDIGTDRTDADGTDWLGVALAEVARGEYRPSWQASPHNGLPAGWQAPNRAQDLRFAFSVDGLVTQSRTGDSGQWSWKMSVVSPDGSATEPPRIGHGSEAVAVARGRMSEKFTNEPEGLRHEIRIDCSSAAGCAAPHGGDAAGPILDRGTVAVVLEFAGDVTVHRDGRHAIELRSGGDVVSRYWLTDVYDASGRAIDSSLVSVAASATGNTTFAVTVDDRSAAYPLRLQARITGAATLPAWTVHGTVIDARLGTSIATAGDVNGDGHSDVIVGVPGFDGGQPGEGMVQVYHGSPDGLSTQPNWTAESNEANARFGHSVSTAGDVNGDGWSDIIVGAPTMPVDPGPQVMGAVYVWYGSASGLGDLGVPANADWSRSGYQVNSGFGASVSVAGDTNGNGYSDVIVGAPGIGSPTPIDGWAYLYTGSATGMHDTVAWLHGGEVAGDAYGWSVATAGDVNGDGRADIAVGAPMASLGGHNANGAVYVYLGATPNPSNSAHLRWGPEDDDAAAGTCVGTAGDVDGDGYAELLVGAPRYGADASKFGAVFLFDATSAGLSGVPAWSAVGDAHESGFGLAAATAGDVNGDGYADVIVGQPVVSKSYIWHGGGGGLGPWGTTSNADWRAEGHADSAYGSAVATAGDVNGDGYSDVLVGAPARAASFWRDGEAYAYLGGPDELTESPAWSRQSGQDGASLGWSVSTAGDVNGDGYADLAAGAPDYDNSYEDEGVVVVWHGSASGPTGNPGDSARWRQFGGVVGARLGTSIAAAGDVNGDGYGDLIAGAPGYDAGQMFEGAAFVWWGSPNGLLHDDTDAADGASWWAESNQTDSSFGGAVAGAGDVNGDGYADVVVGAKAYDAGQTDEGAVFLWHGSTDGLGEAGNPGNADWHDEGDVDALGLGGSVSAAGDVNWDGFGDLIAGGANVAAVWYGTPDGLPVGLPSWLRASAQPSSLFGHSVAGAGDINGDGFADVVIGAPLHSGSVAYEGGAWAYCGDVGGLAATPCWTDLGGRSLAALGWAVGAAGDLNGDGFADIVAGAPGWSNAHEAEGQARVYYGSPWAPISYNGGDWSRESNTVLANLGYAVGTAGDVSGDGYADLLVGAPRLPGATGREGGVLLYYGNGHPGRPALPRQTWIDGTTIAPGGLSNSQSAFDLRLAATSPSGRGKVRVTSEVKPLGSLFDGAKKLALVWHDSGTTGYAHRETVTGLVAETGYHWRARVQHNAVTSPFDPPFGRWFHAPWNGWNETDLRTSGVGRFIVNSDADDSQTHDFHPGDGACSDYRGACSLRAALEETNAHQGPDEITFVGPLVITIDASQGALPTVVDALTIDAGPNWRSGDDRPGVSIQGAGAAADGLVLAADVCNIFGLHITDFGRSGVRVSSAGNRIGGPILGQGNVLSGNGEAGVYLFGAGAHGNSLQGNRIGLSPDGSSAEPNGTGVLITDGAADNTIGGTGQREGNTISGNTYDGLSMSGTGSDGNRISGNAFGVDANGPGAVGNGYSAIKIVDGPRDTLIGEAPEFGNLIANSGRDGVYLNRVDRTTIIGGLILSNGYNGVNVQDSPGGLFVWNTISGNGFAGVQIAGALSVYNRIGMSSIYDNGGKGISLMSGAQEGILPPVVVGGSATGVSGTSCAGCVVQVYSDDEDEGRLLQGVAQTDAHTGVWTLVTPLDGPNVTALTTDGNGNSSEFSAPFAVGAGNNFVVDNDGDGADAHDDSPGDGLCRAPAGGCTLRAAIEEANTQPTRDRITFARPMTIALDDALPELDVTDPATIDAGGVWSAAADTPGVRIDGGGSVTVLLRFSAAGCALYGLHLTNADTDALRVTSAGNEIGGSGPGRRNVFSANDNAIRIVGAVAVDNRIRGNYIGTDPTGLQEDGNNLGVRVEQGAVRTVIGGSTADGNVISGNASDGVSVVGSATEDTQIGGNKIGLTMDGLTVLGNLGNGVRIAEGATGTTIGGSGLDPNEIGGNAHHGVLIEEAGTGTSVTGNTVLENGWSGVGIELTAGCVIERNQLAGNAETGVNVAGGTSLGNRIRRNTIFANGVKGIRLMNGANDDIAPPLLASAGPTGASGTACPACVVDVFSDADGQGRTWHGEAVADGTGTWTYTGTLAGPNITGTQTDASGNTSEFSAPVSILPTAVPTPTDAPTATATLSATPGPSPTVTATPTATTMQTADPSASTTPAATADATAEPSRTPTGTRTAALSPTPSRTPSRTSTVGPTSTPGPTGAASGTPGPDVTPTTSGDHRIYAPYVSKRGQLGRATTWFRPGW